MNVIIRSKPTSADDFGRYLGRHQSESDEQHEFDGATRKAAGIRRLFPDLPHFPCRPRAIEGSAHSRKRPRPQDPHGDHEKREEEKDVDQKIEDRFALVGEIRPPEIDPRIDPLTHSIVEAQEY